MQEETVRLAKEGELATITLARPAKRNALSPREHERIQAICRELNEDPAIRVVIFRGEGKIFSAGADLGNPKEAGKPTGDLDRRRRARIGDRTMQAVQSLDAITIAAVQGAAIGGGCVLALACDLRVLAADAFLSVPEVDIAMPLTWGAIPLLMGEIGSARTLEFVATCERLDAPTAHQWGLANHLSEGDPMPRARELAETLLAKPPVAVAMTKTAVRGLKSRYRQGDLTELEGDLYWLAVKLGARYERKPS